MKLIPRPVVSPKKLARAVVRSRERPQRHRHVPKCTLHDLHVATIRSTGRDNRHVNERYTSLDARRKLVVRSRWHVLH